MTRKCKGSTPILGVGCIEISTGAHANDEKILKAFTQISDYLLDIQNEVSSEGLCSTAVTGIISRHARKC